MIKYWHFYKIQLNSQYFLKLLSEQKYALSSFIIILTFIEYFSVSGIVLTLCICFLITFQISFLWLLQTNYHIFSGLKTHKFNYLTILEDIQIGFTGLQLTYCQDYISPGDSSEESVPLPSAGSRSCLQPLVHASLETTAMGL